MKFPHYISYKTFLCLCIYPIGLTHYRIIVHVIPCAFMNFIRFRFQKLIEFNNIFTTTHNYTGSGNENSSSSSRSTEATQFLTRFIRSVSILSIVGASSTLNLMSVKRNVVSKSPCLKGTIHFPLSTMVSKNPLKIPYPPPTCSAPVKPLDQPPISSVISIPFLEYNLRIGTPLRTPRTILKFVIKTS